MKSGHILALPEVAEKYPESYVKVTPDGTKLHRCLQCGSWLTKDVAQNAACPKGVELIVGLKYNVLVAGDTNFYKAMLLRTPLHRHRPCWVIYDEGGGNSVTLAPHERVSVVSYDKTHAINLWDDIADYVSIPEPHPSVVPEPTPVQPLQPRADGTICDEIPAFEEET